MGEMMYPLKATRSGLKQSKAKEAGGQASSNTMQMGRVGGVGGLMTVRSGPRMWPGGQALYPLLMMTWVSGSTGSSTQQCADEMSTDTRV